MISCPTVSKHEIRSHYDLATVFYRLLWGRHIHHGLWNAQAGLPVSWTVGPPAAQGWM